MNLAYYIYNIYIYIYIYIYIRYIRCGKKFVAFFSLDGIKKRHELFPTFNMYNTSLSYFIHYTFILNEKICGAKK